MDIWVFETNNKKYLFNSKLWSYRFFYNHVKGILVELFHYKSAETQTVCVF